jgi:U3 small nucleolar RNA-associated protein 15
MQDDIMVSRPAKKHLEGYDKDLKSFRVSQALDRVLEVSEGGREG